MNDLESQPLYDSGGYVRGDITPQERDEAIALLCEHLKICIVRIRWRHGGTYSEYTALLKK